MKVVLRPIDEVIAAGFEAVFRELGYSDGVRFINQFCPGHGNYTEERHAWLDDVSLDEVLELVKAHERPSDAPAAS